MDAKLKALKVVDLKAILAQAQVAAPTKANKNDLVTRIIASKDALDVYHKLHPTTDDLLAPPEDVDWTTDQPPIPEPTSPITTQEVDSPISKQPLAVASVTTKPEGPSNNATPSKDPEAEKRRQRAARFGIPIVEPPKPRKHQGERNLSSKDDASQKMTAKPTRDDEEKLKARASRFGEVSSQKRPASEAVDAEEEERRRKRAERFGIHLETKS